MFFLLVEKDLCSEMELGLRKETRAARLRLLGSEG